MNLDWVEYGGPWWQFVKERMNKPGTVIEIFAHGDKQRHLIGTVNTHGMAHCCGCPDGIPLFDDRDVVVRYALLEGF